MHRRLVFVIVLSLGVALAPPCAVAQDRARTDSLRTDTLRTDTLRTSTPRADSLRRQEPLRGAGPPAPDAARAASAGGAGRAPVKFSAQDSLVIIFGEEGGDVGTLYGEAQVKHSEITINAYAIDLLMEQNELRARGLPSDTGLVGRPHFQRGGEEGEAFTGRRLAFNLKTKRGRVIGARTKMQDGYIEGEAVATAGDSTVYVAGGSYTTCNCPPGVTPSYSLRSSKMKVQGDWVYTGPLQLYIFNIPMPMWLPFGMLPAIPGRRSGLLPPRFREDERGFSLQDFGWYWAINDYMDFQIRFGLWSRGSWSVSPRFRYEKRYHYGGDISFSYINSVIGEPVDPNYEKMISAQFRWIHRQNINPTTRLRGNINLATQSYLRYDSEDFNDRVRQQIESSVNFSKSWGQGARDITVALRHRQVLSTGAAYLTLPSFSFSQASFKPFARDRLGPGEERRWYERISVGTYNFNLRNSYDFVPFTDRELRMRGDTTNTGVPAPPDISWYEALLSPSKYRRATGDRARFDFNATHTVSLRMPGFTINRLPLIGRLNINVSPSARYREEWYLQTIRKDTAHVRRNGTIDTTVVERTVPGFFARREFNLRLSANTQFFGLFPIEVGSFEGLRHVVRPSLSFSYRPNFAGGFWGYTRTFENAAGERVRYDIRNGSRVGRATQQLSLGFRLSNTFETKRVRVDSTGERHEQRLQLLDLDLSSGYNFAADSLRLAPIRLSARSGLLDNLFNLNLNAVLSPYVYRDGRRISRFVISEPGLWPVRLTRLSISAGVSFDGGPGRRGGRESIADNPFGDTPLRAPAFGDPLATSLGRPDGYVDFSIPWSLNLDLNYNLTNISEVEQEATLGANFSFNLTPEWKIDVRTGYDFMQTEITLTQINVARDLGCWLMSFNWTPTGRFQHYGFTLQVKSGKLAQLLRLNLPRTNIKGRFKGAASGLLNRGGR